VENGLLTSYEHKAKFDALKKTGRRAIPPVTLILLLEAIMLIQN
jgi:hypothetical protein